MGTVTILQETTMNPYTLMGKCAGICYGTNTQDANRNYNRGKQIMADGHGRVAEYPQVYMILDGYSARVIRELYVHIGGAPTRLQASTRYIKYGDFDYITPSALETNAEAAQIYGETMAAINQAYFELLELGIKKEDAANLLPLGMTTKVVIRTNMRQLIEMAHQRLCTRAYWEFRQMMQDIKDALAAYSEEWEGITEEYFVPKCAAYGYCSEHDGCGNKYPQKSSIDTF